MICNLGEKELHFGGQSMKRGLLLATVIGAGCILTGCGSLAGFSPEVTGVSVSRKGKITEVVKESFDASYYSEEELQSQVESEIADYNSSHGDKSVQKKSLKVQNGEAQMRLVYASYQDYSEFNDVGFYVGDINGAIQAGYAFGGSFLPVNDGKTAEGSSVWGSSLMSGKNYNTIVVNEPLLVDVPGTICYVSDGVKVTDKSEAVTETTDTAYILYE